MSILVATVAFSGGLGLQHVQSTMQDVLLRDSHVEQVALQARVSSPQLRRYEKDYFLNIGAPQTQAEYLGKWTTARDELVGHLDELDRLVVSDGDHDTFREMQDELATYVGGFQRVTAAIQHHEIITPQTANLTMTAYKDAMRRFEVTPGRWAARATSGCASGSRSSTPTRGARRSR